MFWEILPSLAIFAVVSSITPGPNNFMLLSSGVNFGFRNTVPHMLGIVCGFFLLLLCSGFGLGAVLTQFPQIYLALKICGGSYLLYLAYRIATSQSMGQAKNAHKPLSFLQAVLFQWVNPKAWVMALTAMSVFTQIEAPFLSVIIIALVCSSLGVPSVVVWTVFGVRLQKYLSAPHMLQRFNWVMGGLLALTIIPMVL